MQADEEVTKPTEKKPECRRKTGDGVTEDKRRAGRGEHATGYSVVNIRSKGKAYGMNVLPPNSSNPTCDGLSGGTSGRSLGPESGALMVGIVSSQQEAIELGQSLSMIDTTSWLVYNPGEGSHWNPTELAS